MLVIILFIVLNGIRDAKIIFFWELFYLRSYEVKELRQMTFGVVKVVRVVKGACLSEERRVKSEKFDTLVDYCYLELK